MAKQYSSEFKMEAIKRVESSEASDRFTKIINRRSPEGGENSPLPTTGNRRLRSDQSEDS